MKKSDLRALQTPLKEHYKTNPEAAVLTLEAEGTLGDDVSCQVQTDAGMAEAGLHPATGGDGSFACSGDMLLEALVACAGVTLKSVATAMEIEIREGTIRAKGLLDFKGTLAVSKESPVGFSSITMTFSLDTDASDKKVAKLIELTERYCVVFQTLQHSPEMKVETTRT